LPEPLVAIVGAPNVGKSTLFNRLVGRRPAIVTAHAGTTRDRIYGTVREGALAFRIVDTGGLAGDDALPFARGIEQQVSAALEEAALVLFLVDARAGRTALDEEIAARLRRLGVPILLAANKIDVESHESRAADFHRLGFGEPIAVSAAHGGGLERLLSAIAERFEGLAPPAADAGSAEEAPPIRVAIVGRPNVGKSSILNRLLGEERQIVSEVPGTTRDAVDTLLVRDGRRYLLVDTAGIRRGGRVVEQVESLAVLHAKSSIRACDVVVLVLDGSEGIVAQDTHIAGHAHDSLRPVVVVVNKWDLVDAREERAKEWQESIEQRLRFAKQAPVVLVSAKSGQRVGKILDLVDRVHAAGGIRVATPELNRWLQEASAKERSGPAGGRSIRLFYATQTGVHPPRFVLFCNHPERVHFSIRRRLENDLRERFGFGPAPMRLVFRGRRGDEAT
jgi:GTP-binding protein